MDTHDYTPLRDYSNVNKSSVIRDLRPGKDTRILEVKKKTEKHVISDIIPRYEPSKGFDLEAKSFPAGPRTSGFGFSSTFTGSA